MVFVSQSCMVYFLWTEFVVDVLVMIQIHDKQQHDGSNNVRNAAQWARIENKPFTRRSPSAIVWTFTSKSFLYSLPHFYLKDYWWVCPCLNWNWNSITMHMFKTPYWCMHLHLKYIICKGNHVIQCPIPAKSWETVVKEADSSDSFLFIFSDSHTYYPFQWFSWVQNLTEVSKL